MNRKIDDLGRFVIPSEMRKELKLDNGSVVKVELVEGQIILSNPEVIDYKARCEAALDELHKFKSISLEDAEKLCNILEGDK